VEILFEVKTIEQPNSVEVTDGKLIHNYSVILCILDDKYLTGMQHLAVEIYEHVSFEKSLAIEVVNNIVMFKNFPSGSVIALK
jgi:hypothetical protein